MEATAEGGWWIIATTPEDGIHMYQLKVDHLAPLAERWRAARTRRHDLSGDGEPPSMGHALAHLAGLYAEAVRRKHGFPLGDHWMDEPAWSLRISPGGDIGTDHQPHPKLLAKATVHDTLPDIEVTA